MFFRQKLDNIMPTLPGAEEGVRTARKFLSEKLLSPHQLSRNSAKESSVSIVSSTMNQIGKFLVVPTGYVCLQLNIIRWHLNQIRKMRNIRIILGQEARNTKNSISAAFSSMFGMKKSRGMVHSPSSHNTSSPQNSGFNENTSSPVNSSKGSPAIKSVDSSGSYTESSTMG